MYIFTRIKNFLMRLYCIFFPKEKKFSKIQTAYNKYILSKIETNELYGNIEREYKTNKNLNITLEKILVKERLEGYVGRTEQIISNLNWILITAIITTLFNFINNEKEFFLFEIIVFVMLIIFIFFSRNNIKKESNEHIYYTIRLEILEKLEKEKEENK